jgi:hypothetical protein
VIVLKVSTIARRPILFHRIYDNSFISAQSINITNLVGTLEEVGGIIDGILGVVVDQPLSPDAPGLVLFQDWNGSVQEGDRSSSGVMVSDPCDSRSDPIGFLVGDQTVTGVFVDFDGIEDWFDHCPQISHVEVVDNSFQWSPVGSESVIGLSDSREDSINQSHC